MSAIAISKLEPVDDLRLVDLAEQEQLTSKGLGLLSTKYEVDNSVHDHSINLSNFTVNAPFTFGTGQPNVHHHYPEQPPQ